MKKRRISALGIVRKVSAFYRAGKKRAVTYFDFSSYDLDGDIPRIFVGGDNMKVDSVWFFGTKIYVTGFSEIDDCRMSYTLHTQKSWKTADAELMSQGIIDLMREAYYNHPKSYEIGDFELNFL